MKFLVVKHGESIVVFAKMPVDALDKTLDLRDEGSYSSPFFFRTARKIFFDDFLQFHGRNILNFSFLVTGVKIFFKNFYVVQGFLFCILVFNFFCKLFNLLAMLLF